MRFVIPGRVAGKGRPRAVMIGGAPRILTPAKTRVAEATVRQFAAEAMRGKPLMGGPLWLSVTIWQLHPQSWSKKRKAESVYVTGKPDCDNVLKLIGDALNGIVWADDAQIADAHIRRMFTFGTEHVEIEIGYCSDKNLQPSTLHFRELPKQEIERAAA